MADAQEFLKDFPLLKMKMNGKQIAYLDNGATTQKPEQIIHKMVDGRIGKYYEENCLLQQAFVKENKVSVENHIKAVAKELGGEIKLVKCVRFEKGEGIEKKQDDFAAEVASMAK